MEANLCHAVEQIAEACVTKSPYDAYQLHQLSASTAVANIYVNVTTARIISQHFGDKMPLLGIRGDGHCYSRCLATMIFWLHQNSQIVPDYEKFKDEFESVIVTFTKTTTMLSISTDEKLVHMAVRNLISSRLKEIVDKPNFVDAVNKNCQNISFAFSPGKKNTF